MMKLFTFVAMLLSSLTAFASAHGGSGIGFLDKIDGMVGWVGVR